MENSYSLHETIKDFQDFTGGKKFKTIYADPPWQFTNRTGKVAPEHKRLNRYSTMKLADIMAIPVSKVLEEKAHLYLWIPNALLPEGLRVMQAWGFEYKTNLVWEKVRKDGMSDGRGLVFIFVMRRNFFFLELKAIIIEHCNQVGVRSIYYGQ